MKQINLRNQIIDELGVMLKTCDGRGKNPYIVNVITFSGHGISYNGDDLAAIPEYEEAIESEDQPKVVRFINLSDWAR
jgi:hypothetical protein